MNREMIQEETEIKALMDEAGTENIVVTRVIMMRDMPTETIMQGKEMREETLITIKLEMTIEIGEKE